MQDDGPMINKRHEFDGGFGKVTHNVFVQLVRRQQMLEVKGEMFFEVDSGNVSSFHEAETLRHVVDSVSLLTKWFVCVCRFELTRALCPAVGDHTGHQWTTSSWQTSCSRNSVDMATAWWGAGGPQGLDPISNPLWKQRLVTHRCCLVCVCMNNTA